MEINWIVIENITSAVASLATAVGVGVVIWQINLSKQQQQSAFEDSLDQQYRALSLDISVNVLIGGMPGDGKRAQTRELIYNYLDLSNEQVYLRAKARISEKTWESWAQGIETHLSRPFFREIYEEVKGKSSFSYLDKLVSSEYKSDPINWS